MNERHLYFQHLLPILNQNARSCYDVGSLSWLARQYHFSPLYTSTTGSTCDTSNVKNKKSIIKNDTVGAVHWYHKHNDVRSLRRTSMCHKQHLSQSIVGSPSNLPVDNCAATQTSHENHMDDSRTQQRQHQQPMVQPSNATTNIQVLFFSQVPIEPTYSAAGVRSQNILNQLLQYNKPAAGVRVSTNENNDNNNTNVNVTTVHIISPPSQLPPADINTAMKVSLPETEQTEQKQINLSNSTLPSQQLLPSSDSDEATETEIEEVFQYHSLLPNRTNDAFDLLNKICTISNHRHQDIFYIVIYDRYYSEEMYAFHVYNFFQQQQHQPNNNYMFLLDMQDMHSLRHTRQLWVKRLDQERKKQFSTKCLPTRERTVNEDATTTTDNDILQATIPSDDIVPSIVDDDKLLRELACIYRCDLTLVCSSYEYNLLIHHYHIPPTKLCIAPLFGSGDGGTSSTTQTGELHRNEVLQEQFNSKGVVCNFHERYDYVFVGGMKHDPNVDAIRQLHRLWPRIRQKFIDNNIDDATVLTGNQLLRQPHCRKLPNLYIYGANCSDHFRNEIHNPNIGIYMEGYYPLAITNVLYNKRVLLSPIRYGAGIKGKHVEAWNCSLPIVTTSIGSEGMLYPDTYNCPKFLFHSVSSMTTTSSTMDHPMKQQQPPQQQQPKFGGLIANSDAEFVNAAYTLYANESVWETLIGLDASCTRKQVLYKLCHDWDRIYQRIIDVVRYKLHHQNGSKQQLQQQPSISSFHAADTIQHILRHQANRSTEYFSKYIELKENTKGLKQQ